MKIGYKVKYYVAIGFKSQDSKLLIEEFEIYKVTDYTVWLKNQKTKHCVAYKTEINRLNNEHQTT